MGQWKRYHSMSDNGLMKLISRKERQIVKLEASPFKADHQMASELAYDVKIASAVLTARRLTKPMF